ncbi:CAP domain-containing protein [Patulibacter sp. SYSU D01012]|uniref:CAP domain-containing protein n=1 Tax=Patulibacter sp. SYSU D01012 TaxID=2817381 RepID=UPI001B317109|nr:CAP domain-containing protein [Patulibacter sp. SYSU D01012]
MVLRSRVARGHRPLHIALALVATLLLLALAAPGRAAAAPCADADADPAAVGAARAVEAVRCLTNRERVAVGLRALDADPAVARAAQGLSDDMQQRGYFSHVTLDGLTLGVRITAAGLSWSAVGENIALGQATPREVVRDWLASEKHCVNLFSAAYTLIGIGTTPSGRGPYWVQDFARPLAADAPKGPAVPCPRAPIDEDAEPVPAPAAPSVATPAAPPAADEAGAQVNVATPSESSSARRLRTVAHRSGRTLRIRIALPGATRRSVRVLVHQGHRTVWRAAGRARAVRAMRVRLPRPAGGRVTVAVAGSRPVVARFR